MESVVEYFEKTVQLFPTKIAIETREQSITFSSMNHMAKKYAAIISKTKQRDMPVGVFANRSIDPAVWYLAVLYSGNFYVPIDPDIPLDKMQKIFEDARFENVLGAEENYQKISQLRYSGNFITKDDLNLEEYSNPASDSLEPAYMVYTSGSTGEPKGVLKSHRSIISFIEAYCETFDFSSEDIIGNQTPFFFDAAAKDFYLMLKQGMTIEIIPTELFAMSTQLIEYMNERKITFASWVPTALSLVAQLSPFSLVKPETLTKVFFVGEVMPMKHLNKWRKEVPYVEYVNLYGQSEIAGICCYYKVDREFKNDETLPMGKPMKNCTVYLMDGDELILESGKVGELYIASDALATEYYHDQLKTANSFVEKDFGHGLVKCFKTGDLAQYDASMNLVFASRTDSQIKHMGRRIELGEIESVAGALPDINRCCCLYNSKKKKIVLFCELVDGVVRNGTEIQSMLRKCITSYMLPNKVIVMDKLPLNANGKIDRNILKTRV